MPFNFPEWIDRLDIGRLSTATFVYHLSSVLGLAGFTDASSSALIAWPRFSTASQTAIYATSALGRFFLEFDLLLLTYSYSDFGLFHNLEIG